AGPARGSVLGGGGGGGGGRLGGRGGGARGPEGAAVRGCPASRAGSVLAGGVCAAARGTGPSPRPVPPAPAPLLPRGRDAGGGRGGPGRDLWGHQGASAAGLRGSTPAARTAGAAAVCAPRRAPVDPT